VIRSFARRKQHSIDCYPFAFFEVAFNYFQNIPKIRRFCQITFAAKQLVSVSWLHLLALLALPYNRID
jgi:hypothetical protein